jgi:putative spermidine/putrescine transport system substrate-binding protein
MVALMRTGGGGGGGQYDLVSASGDASLRLVYGKDVVPINVNLLPGWKSFFPYFKSPAHNTVNGVHYGISLQWGPNTLIYNTKKVKSAPTSWSVVYGKKYAGKISIPNNPIQIADAALYLMKTKPALGIRDSYELTKPQFDAAVSLLKKQKPLVKRYWNYAADQITDFKSGDVIVGSTWPYQTLTLQAGKTSVKDLIPREGTTGWADTWMLAAKAPHPNCAYLWMKYVTMPKVEAQQAIVFGETPVTPLACPYMNKLQAGSCAQYHLNAPAAYLKSIHFWKVPIADCGWGGRKDCVDFTTWQQAWTQITG